MVIPDTDSPLRMVSRLIVVLLLLLLLVLHDLPDGLLDHGAGISCDFPVDDGLAFDHVFERREVSLHALDVTG